MLEIDAPKIPLGSFDRPAKNPARHGLRQSQKLGAHQQDGLALDRQQSRRQLIYLARPILFFILRQDRHLRQCLG
jgi:hypothetical protein